MGAAFAGAGLMAPRPYNIVMIAVPATMFFLAVGKWWIWDQAVESWNNYKKEKRELFETIREGKQL